MERSLPATIPAFLTHLELERGLSPHTVAAYGRDLRRFERSLAADRRSDVSRIGEREVFEFIVRDRREGRDPSSTRRGLAALRTFFRFLNLTGQRSGNPARLVDSPAGWRLLPSVLSEEEVGRLLGAPAEEGARNPLRDRALLELIYACGLRVSEAAGLTLPSVHWDLG